MVNSLSWELNKNDDQHHGSEVCDGQLVELLTDVCLPALGVKGHRSFISTSYLIFYIA